MLDCFLCPEKIIFLDFEIDVTCFFFIKFCKIHFRNFLTYKNTKLKLYYFSKLIIMYFGMYFLKL